LRSIGWGEGSETLRGNETKPCKAIELGHEVRRPGEFKKGELPKRLCKQQAEGASERWSGGSDTDAGAGEDRSVAKAKEGNLAADREARVDGGRRGETREVSAPTHEVRGCRKRRIWHHQGLRERVRTVAREKEERSTEKKGDCSHGCCDLRLDGAVPGGA
jgi:hypothetical protein